MVTLCFFLGVVLGAVKCLNFYQQAEGVASTERHSWMRNTKIGIFDYLYNSVFVPKLESKLELVGQPDYHSVKLSFEKPIVFL